MIAPVRSEPCVCGVVIWSVDDPVFIAIAVLAHQRSRVHRTWRARVGL